MLPGGQVVTGCMNTSGHTSENVSVQIWGVDGATVSGDGQLWSPQCSFCDNPNSVWGFQPGFTENSFIAKGGGGNLMEMFPTALAMKALANLLNEGRSCPELHFS